MKNCGDFSTNQDPETLSPPVPFPEAAWAKQTVFGDLNLAPKLMTFCLKHTELI